MCPVSESLAHIHHLARVPEHSLALMQSMSGGKAIVRENYLFFADQNWLIAVGYPLNREISAKPFEKVIEEIVKELQATEIFAIAPEFTGVGSAKLLETDRYYVLPATAPIPANLRNPVKKAATLLEISESDSFTQEHRKLWREFLGRHQNDMNSRVKELYLRTPFALMQGNGNIKLLDAHNPDGMLVASLLLDYSPENFCSYILGAHSKTCYVPHAMDALFAKMLEYARDRKKRFIHLGLGVNQGILRFKQKWGAIPSHKFSMAQWTVNSDFTETGNFAQTLCQVILRSPSSTSARQFIANEPTSKPFSMLWEISKNAKTSWLAGTAHFFLHSFEPSFRKLFSNVDNVLFEGPLDSEFMAQVNMAGRRKPASMPSLLTFLTSQEIMELERTIFGKSKFWAASLYNTQKNHLDIPHLLSTAWPWHVFFTLWTTFLENQGWHQSVDMEAWRIANDMNKNIVAMENLEEQLESLQSLPIQRAINFFKSSHTWKKRASQNRSAYLAGDLEKMMGSSAEFPTRTEHIVGRRDQRFRERMRPWLEKGNAAVFVGSAHIVNLRHMLREDGFEVRQAPFGLYPKLQLGWRKLTRPDERIRW